MTPGYERAALRAENTNRVGKIEFYEAHALAGGPWAVNAAGIGLTPASVTALGTPPHLTTAARAAFNANLL